MHAVAAQMDSETLDELCRTLQRDVIAADHRQALLGQSNGVLNPRGLARLLARRRNPVAVHIRTPGDTVVLEDGNRYAMTTTGSWEPADTPGVMKQKRRRRWVYQASK